MYKFAALWKSLTESTSTQSYRVGGRARAKGGEYSFEVYVHHELNNIKFNLIFIKFIWNVCISLASSCSRVCACACMFVYANNRDTDVFSGE